VSLKEWEEKVLSRPGARERIDALHAELQTAPTNLWLDDVRPAPDATWRHATTAQEAIDWLQRSFFNVVSLDHDLGPPEAGTGYDVLVWLERAIAEGDWRTEVPELRIHSANPVGRANMTRAIESIQRLADGLSDAAPTCAASPRTSP
jgi:hypothetical protein